FSPAPGRFDNPAPRFSTTLAKMPLRAWNWVIDGLPVFLIHSRRRAQHLFRSYSLAGDFLEAVYKLPWPPGGFCSPMSLLRRGPAWAANGHGSARMGRAITEQ